MSPCSAVVFKREVIFEAESATSFALLGSMYR